MELLCEDWLLDTELNEVDELEPLKAPEDWLLELEDLELESELSLDADVDDGDDKLVAELDELS